jgi:zinc protease
VTRLEAVLLASVLAGTACSTAHPPPLALAPAPAPAPAPTQAPPAASSAPPAVADAPFRLHPPEADVEKPFVVPGVERATLHGGIPVFIAQEPSTFVTLYVLARGGLADVPADRVEVLRQLADMLPRATTSQTERALSDVYAALYMPRPMSTWWADAVVLRVTGPASKLRDVTELAADFALHPAFDQRDFNRVRDLEADDYERDASNGGVVASRILRPVLFGSHPYGGVHGSAAHMRAVTRADVVALHARIFDRGRLSLVVTGGADSKLVLEALDDAFSGPPGKAIAREGVAPPAAQPTGPRLVVVDMPGAAIANIAMGVLAPPAGAGDAEAALIATQMLADGSMGRLAARLRDGLGIVPFVSISAYEARAGGILGWTTRAPTARVPNVLTEAARVMRDLASAGPSEEELAWARDREVYSLASSFETSASSAYQFANAVATGQSAESVALRPAQYAAVTTATARAAAARYLDPDKVRAVVVGDWATLREPLTALGWGAVELRAADGTVVKGK